MGLPSHISTPFCVEEKADDYNIRFFHDGQTYALTRGSHICAFTRDRLSDFVNLKVFEDNPHLVLCMEAAEPENPYVEESPPYVKEDIGFFLFDIMVKNHHYGKKPSGLFTL